MQIRVELPDDIYWFVFDWAALEQRKAYQQAQLLIIQAVEDERKRRHPNDAPEAA